MDDTPETFDESPSARSTRSMIWIRLRRIAAWALVFGALAFIYRSLAPEITLLRQEVRNINWWQVFAAMVAGVPLYVVKGCYHLNALDRLSGVRGSRRSGLPIFLQAQIVRYLPGKIWGVVYQSQRMARNHRTGDVVIANAWQMIITNILALGVISALLLAKHFSPMALLLLIPVLLGVEWLHRKPIIESWGLRWLGRLLPRFAPLASSRPLSPMPWKGTFLLCMEWGFYLLAFLVLLYGKADWTDILLLAAWYSAASILALVAFVVPAGIAVREAIFVGAPNMVGMDPASLILIAALVRIAFFGSEAIAATASSLFAIGKPHEHG